MHYRCATAALTLFCKDSQHKSSITLIKKDLLHFIKNRIKLYQEKLRAQMVLYYKWFYELLVWFPPIILAIGTRELIKAKLCAYRGDVSVRTTGATRFSIENFDPMGSIISPLLLILSRNYVYSWAKPIKIRKDFLKRGQTDVIIIVLCGLLSNFVMACCWRYVEYIPAYIEHTNPFAAELLLIMAKAGVQINTLLITIHLIPLPPLDASYIVRGHLPRYPKAWYTFLDNIGHYCIFGSLLFKILQPYIHPIYQLVLFYVHSTVG